MNSLETIQKLTDVLISQKADAQESRIEIKDLNQNEFFIYGNRAGLISLSARILSIATGVSGSHFHLDDATYAEAKIAFELDES